MAKHSSARVKHSLTINYERCIGCYACEVSCQQENNLPRGTTYIHVIKTGPVRVAGKLTIKFVPTRCIHCAEAPCIGSCPVGAITKRADGIVIVNDDVCIGCRLCIEACPLAAPQFNPEKNVVGVCNLCIGRLEKGLTPVCVQHCVARAMHVTTTDLGEVTS
jgi:Fe-S-cluster-containing dehydrogenase component